MPPLFADCLAAPGFWLVLVLHLGLFALLARLRGLPAAFGLAAALFAGSVLAAVALELLLRWLLAPGLAGAPAWLRFGREFAPWPPGFLLAWAVAAIRNHRRQRDYEACVETLKSGL